MCIHRYIGVVTLFTVFPISTGLVCGKCYNPTLYSLHYLYIYIYTNKEELHSIDFMKNVSLLYTD